MQRRLAGGYLHPLPPAGAFDRGIDRNRSATFRVRREYGTVAAHAEYYVVTHQRIGRVAEPKGLQSSHQVTATNIRRRAGLGTAPACGSEAKLHSCPRQSYIAAHGRQPTKARFALNRGVP